MAESRLPAFVLAAVIAVALALAIWPRHSALPAQTAVPNSSIEPEFPVPAPGEVTLEEARRSIPAPKGQLAAGEFATAISDPVTSVTPTPCIVWDDSDSAANMKFSQGRAKAAARLLATEGIPAPLFPLSSIEDALAAPRRVAHLVTISRLSKKQLDAINSFIGRGGHIIVHFSEAESLAGVFGLKPPKPPLEKPSGGGNWTGFSFSSAPPLHAPKTLSGTASAVYRISPTAQSDAKAIAYWNAPNGASGPPAIFRGSAGFWITRPLYDDAPPTDTARLLLSLSATLDPPLWRLSARTLHEGLWTGVGAVSLVGAESKLLAEAPASNATFIREKFTLLRTLEEARIAKASKGLYGSSLSELWQMQRELALADAAAHPIPRKGKSISVWAKSISPPLASNWTEAGKVLRRAGVTDIYLYAGSLSNQQSENSFENAARACRNCGIKVHAWILALEADTSKGAKFSDPALGRRLLHSPKRDRTLPWLDPAVKANGDELCEFVRRMAALGVDGISLDYFRYPEEATSEKRDPAKLEALLVRVRNTARAVNPQIEISLACYAYQKTVSQEWEQWLEKGLLDRALVMNYAPDVETLKRYMKQHPRIRERQLCGIGAGANESFLGPRELLDQIRVAWNEGYGGVAIFPYDARFVSELAEPLAVAQ